MSCVAKSFSSDGSAVASAAGAGELSGVLNSLVAEGIAVPKARACGWNCTLDGTTAPPERASDLEPARLWARIMLAAKARIPGMSPKTLTLAFWIMAMITQPLWFLGTEQQIVDVSHTWVKI
mmetsp:Transcript_38505/g.71504  ORF Transcript_38505/g.71504 Transcript_38505/m.71504 type:complete len:122 (-) Transcript_38505:2-367(-)